MSAEFEIISPNGAVMPLLENKYFYLVDVDGQTTYNGSISSQNGGGEDGAKINSITTNPRSIVITLPIKSGVDVEAAKRYIFSFCKPKQKHKIIWRRLKRELVIEGVLEKADMPRWEKGVICQLTFFCEQPYWEDIKTAIKEISNIIPLHYFTNYDTDMLYFDDDNGGIVMDEIDTARTQTHNNSGDVAVGVEITINALKTVTNPIIYTTPTKFIGVSGVTLQAGEKIIITTHKGNKDIIKDGVSIIEKMTPGSTFIQLETGDNVFTINSDEAETDNMYFEIAYNQRYV